MQEEEPIDGILGELMAWAAAARAAEGASERSRTRSLLEQAVADATWSGLMVDLAEDEAPVIVKTAAARWTGRLVGTGQDFVVLERPSAGPVLLRLESVISIGRSGDSVRVNAAAGNRPPPLSLDLAGALEGLVAEGSPVTVWAAGEAIRGRLTGAGRDLVSVRPEGSRSDLYLRLGALDAVELR
ncbi:MAG TPA: hypothetical protein VFH70_01000 [Acidimicrobiales bacterium]|nr:hypothetical protein [Acidimicrobiales bacterium]